MKFSKRDTLRDQFSSIMTRAIFSTFPIKTIGCGSHPHCAQYSIQVLFCNSRNVIYDIEYLAL